MDHIVEFVFFFTLNCSASASMAPPRPLAPAIVTDAA
jgi:hypothetical protein